MTELSILRLYLLRAMYLLMAVGLGITLWPRLLFPAADLPEANSVVRSVLGAISLLALLGLRYPIKMLPLLFFEFLWKFIWVVRFGLPLSISGTLDANRQETLFACLMGVVLVPLVVPWDYVFRHYLRASGDRWLTIANPTKKPPG